MLKHLLGMAFVATALMLPSVASASPGKTVCDVRSVELTWSGCQPTGVIARGACGDVVATSSDFIGPPSIGYVYFQCRPGLACADYAAAIAGASDPTHCVDFYFGTRRSDSMPLPAPEPSEYPLISVVGCDKLKSFAVDAGIADLGGIDYRSVPAGCGDAGDAVLEAGMAETRESGMAQAAEAAMDSASGLAPDAETSASAAAEMSGSAGDSGGCSVLPHLAPSQGSEWFLLIPVALSLRRTRRISIKRQRMGQCGVTRSKRESGAQLQS